MYKTLLDNVSYSKETGLISHAVVYVYDGEKVSKLGEWHRDDIVSAIKNGLDISRACIIKRSEGDDYGQVICLVKIVEIDGEVYLKNSEYCSDLKNEDMIEMNYGIKRTKMY